VNLTGQSFELASSTDSETDTEISDATESETEHESDSNRPITDKETLCYTETCKVIENDTSDKKSLNF
jgi:hypothetical protein